MNIEWDEKKNQINQRKHSISFELAAHVFTDTLRQERYDDMHSSSEEDRVIVIGNAQGRLLMVVITEPYPDTIRIISARKAKKHERSYYNGNG